MKIKNKDSIEEYKIYSFNQNIILILLRRDVFLLSTRKIYKNKIDENKIVEL